MRYGKGPLGALMDEYERAMNEFIALIDRVDPKVYSEVLDPVTTHETCQTISGIAYHVIMGAYGYAEAIRLAFGLPLTITPPAQHPLQPKFAEEMQKVFRYTESVFEDRWSMNDDDLTNTRIPIEWSDHHDLEAMLEHAIVHILRHRRQIEYLQNHSRLAPKPQLNETRLQ